MTRQKDSPQMTDGGERSRKSCALESPLEVFLSQNSEKTTNSTTFFNNQRAYNFLTSKITRENNQMNGLSIFLLLFDSGALGKILAWHGEPTMPNGNSTEIIF